MSTLIGQRFTYQGQQVTISSTKYNGSTIFLKNSLGQEIEVNMEKLAFDYIDLIEKYQPKEFWKTRLQRFFTYYSQNFLFSHYAQTEFLNAKDNDDLRKRIKAFFNRIFCVIVNCNFKIVASSRQKRFIKRQSINAAFIF